MPHGASVALAQFLATAGADVVVNYVTSEFAATEVAQEIQQLGGRVATVKADVP